MKKLGIALVLAAGPAQAHHEAFVATAALPMAWAAAPIVMALVLAVRKHLRRSKTKLSGLWLRQDG